MPLVRSFNVRNMADVWLVSLACRARINIRREKLISRLQIRQQQQNYSPQYT
jgi:hypothetical protein